MHFRFGGLSDEIKFHIKQAEKREHDLLGGTLYPGS